MADLSSSELGFLCCCHAGEDREKAGGLGWSERDLTGESPLKFVKSENLLSFRCSLKHLTGESPLKFVKSENLLSFRCSLKHLTGESPLKFVKSENLLSFRCSLKHLAGESPLKFVILHITRALGPTPNVRSLCG
ncbi:hypothetical protein BEP19_02110 [Ammoniphilus oxalaticus]|uniref:Uncharacterized protein n=1 Tax=Ammoniphilus oxalaticus TaxID=66863 RepID=A0A419SNG5_9BACL|nr:hypothetical protein BEP19_02110 [Ammoniphilus oxalaticus]